MSSAVGRPAAPDKPPNLWFNTQRFILAQVGFTVDRRAPIHVATEPLRSFLPRSLRQGKREHVRGFLSHPESDPTTFARSPLDRTSHMSHPNPNGGWHTWVCAWNMYCIDVRFCSWVLGVQGSLRLRTTALATSSKEMAGSGCSSGRLHRLEFRERCFGGTRLLPVGQDEGLGPRAVVWDGAGDGRQK